MKEKGFIFVLEMITTVIILFIMFNFFFSPGGGNIFLNFVQPFVSFRHKWDEALLNLLTRDIILSLERNNKLYDYSFDPSRLKKFLYQQNLVPSSLTVWSGTENAIKKEITIACNCPDDIVTELEKYNLKINGRDISFVVVPSGLQPIPKSDVLLIWGYKDLTPYHDSLLNYLKIGGIVEVSDITNLDNEHREIFGLTTSNSFPTTPISYLEFSRKPENSRDIIYEAWKYLSANFNQNHHFSNFLSYKGIIAQDSKKVLLKSNVNTANNEIIPAVVLSDRYGKAAWVANFTENGIIDEEKSILISLLFWASNKHETNKPSISSGYENSYISVTNQDFFEVYAFNLGIGSP
jgi:hypothetical protein